MPSPMYAWIVPPNSSTVRLMRETHSPINAFTSSGPSRSPKPVEPTTSANRAVTGRSSSEDSLGTGAGWQTSGGPVEGSRCWCRAAHAESDGENIRPVPRSTDRVAKRLYDEDMKSASKERGTEMSAQATHLLQPQVRHTHRAWYF